MGAFAALVRMELRSTFGWKPLDEYRNYKDWLRLGGLVLLALLVVADIGFLFVASAVSQYQALKGRGLQGLLVLNGATSASVALFVLGFLAILSGFSLSPAEAQLFSLPLGDRTRLAARFVVVYVSQAAIGLFIFGASLAVYGISEAPPLAFWLIGLVVALALPLPPLALAWILAVLLLSAGRFMRSKNAILLLSGVIGVGFALAFNLALQQSMARLGDPAWILAHYAGPGTALNLAGSAWPPSYLAWKALEAAASGRSLEGFALAIALFAGGLAFSALAVPVLAGPWKRAVLAFGETRPRLLGKGDASAYIGRHFRRRGVFAALLLREWRLLVREPMFLLNGPFIIVIMPLILAVMYLAQRSNLAQLQAILAGSEGGRYGFLAAAGFGAFLGSSTSVGSTALSRDARALGAMLALPVGVFRIMGAKLVHALIWALAGSLMGSVSLGLFAGLGPGSIAGAAIVALSFSALANLAGLWIDTARPRLAWDNPMAALKQNPNSVLLILGSVALLALIAWPVTAFAIDPGLFVAIFALASIVLFAAGLAAYKGFAIIKMRNIEPH